MAQRFADPGMEGRLDLVDQAYRDAREAVEGMRTEGHAPRPLPAALPLGFRDDLRDPAACDAHALLRRVGAAVAAEGAGKSEAGPR